MVGLTAHRTIEMCVRSDSLEIEQAWQRACVEYAALGQDPRNRPDARRTLLRLGRRLPQLLAFIEACSPVRDLLTEQELLSRNGQIYGIVDLIVVGEQSSVVDYKTGFVTEETQPLAHHLRQLALYAHLVSDCLSTNVSRAAIFSLREGIVTVDVSETVRNPIVEECLAALQTYNERVPGTQPAVPSVGSCSYCPFIGRCDEFWGPQGLEGGLELTSGTCITGRVNGPPLLTTSGFGAVELTLGANDLRAVVTDIPGDLLSDVKAGNIIRCWRLRADPATPATMEWKREQSGIAVVFPQSDATAD